MKAIKVLVIVLLSSFVYSAAIAQPHHKPHFRKHHVIRHKRPHRG